jgi:hypothetical protein
VFFVYKNKRKKQKWRRERKVGSNAVAAFHSKADS